MLKRSISLLCALWPGAHQLAFAILLMRIWLSPFILSQVTSQ